jgi:hypothetical protein
MPLLVVFLLTALPLPWLAHILASAGSHVLDAHVVKRRERFTVDIALRVTGSRQACGLFGRPVPGKSTVLACLAGAETPERARRLGGLFRFAISYRLNCQPIATSHAFRAASWNKHVCYFPV